MSKLRTRTTAKDDQNNKNKFKELLAKTLQEKKMSRNSILESKVYQQTRCHTIDSDPTQTLKDKLYNKNITLFRESFRPSDTQILPFLASLRAMKDYRKMYPSAHSDKKTKKPLCPLSRQTDPPPTKR